MGEEPLYRNFISHIDVDRSINNIEYFAFTTVDDVRVKEFKQDIEQNNDVIEMNLIETNSYKEAIVLTLKKDKNSEIWCSLLKDEQKIFSGNKLFYLNNEYSKILVLSIPENMEGKLRMVISRLNRINEKINRFNLKIKKENFDVYQKRTKSKDKKDRIINLINQNLKV
ncbi:hypothetical protein ISS05_03840 [Candidatus Woesearchaeota archaeon]|nr:hypothetical protein [Candidatus Woesearchaeota archaeon]